MKHAASNARPRWTEKINAGHVLTIVTMLAGFLLTYTSIVNKATNVMTAQTGMADTVTKLTLRIDNMDSQGTEFNRRQLAGEQVAGPINARRLDTIEATMSKLSPDVAEIKTNVSWIMGAMKQLYTARDSKQPIPDASR